MSDNNKSNVSVSKPKIGGAIWRAPKSATVPTDAITTLGTGFENLGYISTDGVSNEDTKETQEIKAWGGDVVAVPVTGHKDTFQMTFIEVLRPEVLKTVYGDSNVSGTLETGISVSVDGEDDEEHIYVIDMELNGKVKNRLVIPSGKVTAVGAVIYKDDTAIGYQVTITALPDSSGATHHEYKIKATTT